MKSCIHIYSLIVSFIIVSCTSPFENTGSSSTATSADNVTINFSVQGTGSTTIIFLHGWSNNLSIWDGQMDYFSDKYQTVAIDLAGFGKSGNNRKEWTVSAFAKDVESVYNKLDLDKVVLVGFSMGAPVAVEAARQMGEKVVGIVIVDALQNIDIYHNPEAIQAIDSMMMALIINPSIDNLQGTFFTKNIEASYERILSMIEDNPKIGWSESLQEMLNWNNEECKEALSELMIPIAAINTNQRPTNVEEFRKYAPSFSVKIIPDVGHVIMWDAPDEFNQILENYIQDFTSQ